MSQLLLPPSPSSPSIAIEQSVIRSELRGLSYNLLIWPELSLTEECSVWDLPTGCAPLRVSFLRGRRKLWLAKMWDINSESVPGWGNEERTGVTVRSSQSRAGALLWREGRDNRSRMIKSQITSQLLSNKYHGSYYHTFVEEPVAGAASVYQVQQAWQRHECTETNSFYTRYVFSLRSNSTLMSVIHIILSETNATIWVWIISFNVFQMYRFLFVRCGRGLNQCELSSKAALNMLKWKWWGKASRQLKSVKAAAGFGLRELVWLSVDAVLTASVVESETF